MSYREKNYLKEISKDINSINAPDNIDEYIKRGLDTGINKRRHRKVRRISFTAAVFMCVLFVISIRTSTVFASYVRRIPGFNRIVDLINYDKGIKDALNNGFIENIGQSVEHDNLIFTINDIIIDNSKAVVFYTIENRGNHKYVNIDEMIIQGEGEEIVASSGIVKVVDRDMIKFNKIENTVDFHFKDAAKIPGKLRIDVTLEEIAEKYGGEAEVLPYIWNFEISLDNKKLQDMSKIYEINKAAEIEGQKIFFESLVVTPMQAALKIHYDKSNTKQILHFDDIEIVDEAGEVRRPIVNGKSGVKIDDYNEIIYFQSNYFRDSKELYIRGKSLRAVDKDKLYLKVDLDKKELLTAPDGNIKMKSFIRWEDRLILEFDFKIDSEIEKTRTYGFIYNEITDSNGVSYTIGESTSSQDSDNTVNIRSDIKINKDIKGPIYLKLHNYPQRILEEFKVKIK